LNSIEAQKYSRTLWGNGILLLLFLLFVLTGVVHGQRKAHVVIDQVTGQARIVTERGSNPCADNSDIHVTSTDTVYIEIENACTALYNYQLNQNRLPPPRDTALASFLKNIKPFSLSLNEVMHGYGASSGGAAAPSKLGMAMPMGSVSDSLQAARDSARSAEQIAENMKADFYRLYQAIDLASSQLVPLNFELTWVLSRMDHAPAEQVLSLRDEFERFVRDVGCIDTVGTSPTIDSVITLWRRLASEHTMYARMIEWTNIVLARMRENESLRHFRDSVSENERNFGGFIDSAQYVLQENSTNILLALKSSSRIAKNILDVKTDTLLLISPLAPGQKENVTVYVSLGPNMSIAHLTDTASQIYHIAIDAPANTFLRTSIGVSLLRWFGNDFWTYNLTSTGGKYKVTDFPQSQSTILYAVTLGLTYEPFDARDRTGIALWIPEIFYSPDTKAMGIGFGISWHSLKLGAGYIWVQHYELDGSSVGQILDDPSIFRYRETYGAFRSAYPYVSLSIFTWPPFLP
jgi:hypothetical protein